MKRLLALFLAFALLIASMSFGIQATGQEDYTGPDAGSAGTEEHPGEEEEDENPAEAVPEAENDETDEPGSEPPESADVTYDPQPQSLEEVREWIGLFEAILEESGFMAAIEVKPRWRYEVPEELMPEGYHCELVDWDEDFGAEYYTFFPNPMPMAADATATNTATLQSAIDAAVARYQTDPGTPYVIGITNNIALTKALEINGSANIKFEAAGTGSAATGVTLGVSSAGYRHFAAGRPKQELINNTMTTIAGDDEIILEFAGVTLDGGYDGTGTSSRGGIYSAAREITITGVGITNCYAGPGSGGGILAFGKAGLKDAIVSGCYSGGSGGGIFVWQDFRMENTTVSDCHSSGNVGGGVYFSNDPTGRDIKFTLEMANCVIENNSAAYGGGVCGNGNSVINIYGGSIIRENTATGPVINGGGGVGGLVSSTINVYGGAEITENVSYTRGGGIASIGAVNISGGAKITGNKAYKNAEITGQETGNGGGIYASNKQLTIVDCEISGNTAETKGGGIYGTISVYVNGAEISENEAPEGAGIYNTGNTTISGGKINGNTAGLRGGGIYTAGQVIFNSGEISENEASDGGGVYIGANCRLDAYSDIKITDNKALGSTAGGNGTVGGGGGIYASSNAVITLNGSLIEDNEAANYGGGIFLASNENLSLSANLSVTGGRISGNKATTGGGIGGNNRNRISIGGGAQITNNTAFFDGGGIWFLNGSLDISGLGTAVSGNKAEINGGGILAGMGDNCAVTVRDGAVVGNNTAEYNGGGISTTKIPDGSPVRVTINAATVSSNKAFGDIGGGGIYSPGGSINITGGAKITGNEALSGGGGICTILDAEITVTGSEVTDNQAKTGGGICSESGGVKVENFAAVSGNHAVQGGGIMVGEDASLYINDSAIGDNTSMYEGGGIYILKGGELSAINSNITYNKTSEGPGGGIFGTENIDIEIIGGKIIGNEANADNNQAPGGGIYVNKNSEIAISGSEIRLNLSGHGGGVYARENNTVTIDNTKIIGNTANSYGGGIHVNKKTSLIVSNSELAGNGAIAGGGIYAMTECTADISDSSIKSNSSESGGGIFMNEKCGLTVTGSTVSLNTASISGGGISVRAGSELTVTGGAVIGNKALNGSGGGIEAIDSDVTINGPCNISDNTADANGGGIYALSGDIAVRNATILKNTAGYNGGGIYVGRDAALVVINPAQNHTDILENTAGYNGGGIYVGVNASAHIEGSCHIGLNQATLGDGGGVYTDAVNYTNLNIVTHIIFSGNSASKHYAPPANAYDLWSERIKTTSSTRYNHPVNNLDINVFTYTVAFMSEGVQIGTQSVLGGYKASRPDDPVNGDLWFEGWYKDAAFTGQWDFNTDVVTRSITLYAGWAERILSVSIPIKLLWAAFDGDEDIKSPDYQIINNSTFPIRVTGILIESDGHAGEGLTLVDDNPGQYELRLDIIGGNNISCIPAGTTNPFAASRSGLCFGDAHIFGFLGGTVNNEVLGTTYGTTGWFRIGGKYGGPEPVTALRPIYAMEFRFGNP